MKRLAGKVAVVTGGSRGLGLEIARAYLLEGASVVIASRQEESLERALAELNHPQAASCPCDVGSLQAVRSLRDLALARFGRLDIWVNNAGLAGVYGPTADIRPEAFQEVFEANILGVYHGSLVAMRHFLAQDRGKLINLLGRGDKKPVPFQSAYAPSKAWVRSFTRSLAAEYKASGVGVFAFNPGLLRTDLLEEVQVVSGYEERLKALPTVIRLWAAHPAEAAKKAVWLASSATDGRTGLELQAFGFPQMMTGLAREAWRRGRRERAPEAELRLHPVPKSAE